MVCVNYKQFTNMQKNISHKLETVACFKTYNQGPILHVTFTSCLLWLSCKFVICLQIAVTSWGQC